MQFCALKIGEKKSKHITKIPVSGTAGNEINQLRGVRFVCCPAFYTTLFVLNSSGPTIRRKIDSSI